MINTLKQEDMNFGIRDYIKIAIRKICAKAKIISSSRSK
jgi:hypothetical protein